jgi:DNA repair exonuclease SbcCD ATPase subunit
MSTVKSKKKKTSRKKSQGGKKPSYETVWAMLQEASKEHTKMLKEFEQQMRENAEQHERMKKESDEELNEIKRLHKENERITRRNGKQLGEIHRRFGQLAEHLVAPGIAKRFNELGYHFDLVAPKGLKILDERGKIKTEIDLFMENGSTIMAVEVKSRPVTQDVEHHIKRLEILREKRSQLNDQRKVLGGIAGAIYEDDVKKAVREAGLFVIEQSGDTMKIDMPDDFVPREW